MEPLVNTGQRYPILSEWMKGAGPKHPYATEFQAAPKYDYGQWAELDYLESLLSGLHRAAPGRLEGKRRDFRKLRDKPGHLGMRAELVVAGRLADRGIGFDFGATDTPQPDMVLRDLGLGIEVTTRSTNAEWVLKRELAMAMRVHRPKVHLLMEYSAKPFTIRSKVREQIIQEVDRGGGPFSVVRADGTDLHVGASRACPGSRHRQRPRIGRPSVVDPNKLDYARRLRDEGLTITQIVEKTGITRTTLYRHLPPREPELVTVEPVDEQDARSERSLV